MPYVPLYRLFSRWRGDDDRGEDFDLFSRGFIGEVSWPELLKHQRVVVLAAAGSGKSEELKHEATRLENAGEFAFHATVQSVAKEGFYWGRTGEFGARAGAGPKTPTQWAEEETTRRVMRDFLQRCLSR